MQNNIQRATFYAQNAGFTNPRQSIHVEEVIPTLSQGVDKNKVSLNQIQQQLDHIHKQKIKMGKGAKSNVSDLFTPEALVQGKALSPNVITTKMKQYRIN